MGFKWILIGLLVFPSILPAQKLLGTFEHFWEGMEIGVDGFSGKLLRHRPAQMTFALPDPFWAMSIELRRPSQGDRYWHRFYHNTSLGWTAFVQSFGNGEVLGKAYSIYPFLDLEIVHIQKLQMLFRVGYSFAWLDRMYDLQQNPENTAIGSSLNNLTSIGLLAEYQFAPRWRIRLGGQLTHVSNARYKQPNLGLNTVKIRYGLSYTVQPLTEKRSFDHALYPFRKRWRPYMRMGLAAKEQKIAGGPRYPVYTLSVGAGWLFRPQNQLHLGLSLSYDRGVEAFMLDQEIPFHNSNPKFRPWRPSLTIGHEFLFGRVGILTQTFWYLDRPFVGDEFMGFQLGPNLYWQLPQHSEGLNAFAGIYLKAHKAVADYVAITLGLGW